MQGGTFSVSVVWFPGSSALRGIVDAVVVDAFGLRRGACLRAAVGFGQAVGPRPVVLMRGCPVMSLMVCGVNGVRFYGLRLAKRGPITLYT